MTKKLSEEAVAARVKSLQGWSQRDGKLARRFEFEDFVTAFGWMSAVALCAEKLDHHPDWKNVYRSVDVELHTHDAGGITDKDFALAEAMNRLAERWLSPRREPS